jgi:hypothetical protein
MPGQLLHMAERAEREELVTIRVVPFSKGAHPGLAGPFTLLEFDGPLTDLLYLDAGRGISFITGTDDRIAQYAEKHSRNRRGARLEFTPDRWSAFLASVRQSG